MNDGRIRDNTGNNHGLKVDSFNRAHTDAVTAGEIKFQATLGLSYLMTTGKVALAAGVETPALWMQVTSTTLYGHIGRVLASFNGGDTNHDRTIIVRVYASTPPPTANHVAYVPSNLLVPDSKTPPGTFYVWDGVGAGMTVAANGDLLAAAYGAKGLNDIDFSGALILGHDSVVMFTLEAEEAGGASIVATSYFKELED